jgi:hypothetical protein
LLEDDWNNDLAPENLPEACYNHKNNECKYEEAWGHDGVSQW